MYTQKGFHWFPLVSTKVDMTVNNFTVLYGKKSKSHTCIHMDNRSQFITQTVSIVQVFPVFVVPASSSNSSNI